MLVSVTGYVALKFQKVLETLRVGTIQNLMQVDQGEKVRAYIAVETLADQEYLENNYIVFATRKGVVKKTRLESYSRPRSKGIIAINILEDDELIEARLSNDSSDIVLATRYGQAIRFPEDKVRSMGRNSTGVRGIRLNEDVEGR